MGSQYTVQQNEYGSFNIKLDKNVFHPSEPIKGKVLLEILKQYNASGLLVQLLGEETIKMDWSGNESTNPLIALKKSLWNYLSEDSRKIIEPGYYEVPFELPIPCNAPSSCKFHQESGTSKFNASVNYQVRGMLSSFDIEKLKNLGCTVPINIYENARSECFGEGSTRKFISKYYTFGRGYTIVHAALSSGNIFGDEILQGTLKINNLNCHRDITKIIYRLVEDVKISGVPGRVSDYHSTKNIKVWEALIRIPPRVDYNTKFNVSVPINSNLISVNGNKIKRNYYIEIEPFFPWCNDPFVKIPLHLTKNT